MQSKREKCLTDAVMYRRLHVWDGAGASRIATLIVEKTARFRGHTPVLEARESSVY